jgi:predicted transcriptional regulator
MQLRELIDLLQCQVIAGDHLLEGIAVGACFAADLMSDVLAFSEPGALLITGLASIQSVHTADVADLAAILYVGDKKPGSQVFDLAREKGIPLLATPRTMFEVCGILTQAGLKAGKKG